MLLEDVSTQLSVKVFVITPSREHSPCPGIEEWATVVCGPQGLALS